MIEAIISALSALVKGANFDGKVKYIVPLPYEGLNQVMRWIRQA